MAYSEELAERIRKVLVNKKGLDLAEKKMFGGIAFMVSDHMTVGIVGDALMVRVGEAAYEKALGMKGANEMDFTGRPMKGYVFVGRSGYVGAALATWIDMALANTKTLPPKKTGKRKGGEAGKK